MQSTAHATRRGAIFALLAYGIWGLTPLYFKMIQQVVPLEIVAHRVIWSCLLMLLLISFTRHWTQVGKLLRDPKRLFVLMITAWMVGGNWLLYIWAIQNGKIMEASLGYYMNPLVAICFGMIFLGERFRPLQWLALGLACCGVLLQIYKLGTIPVIGLGLAISFALYGLIRKQLKVDSQTGMLIETLWLCPAALLYLFGFAQSATSNLLHNSWQLNALLLCAGVLTTTPLLLFTAAASLLKLSTLGFCQYIAPTLMFYIALYFGEAFSADRVITFGLIWAALAVFSYDAWCTINKR